MEQQVPEWVVTFVGRLVLNNEAQRLVILSLQPTEQPPAQDAPQDAPQEWRPEFAGNGMHDIEKMVKPHVVHPADRPS